MTDRPITFSAPMIHALWDGRKTQTRRVLKPPYGTLEYLPDRTWRPICTKFFKGDRLWVKEAWRTEAQYDALPPSELPADALIHYEAYGQPPPWAGRYRNARFMPRRFSRLTLIVTDVRVRRVQDISEADARAEGGPPSHPSIDRVSRDLGYADFSRSWFAQTWNSIHGPDAWDRNDWVAALTFTVRRKNIGEMKDD